MSPIKLPRTYADWQQSGEHLANAERIINSVANLEVHMVMPDGTVMRGAIQHSDNKSVVYCRPYGSTTTQPITVETPATQAPPPTS